jgi:predicted transcriptional regulator
MLEKKETPYPLSQIEFNWERVKKKASSKREELVANSPNVKKRELNSRSPKSGEHRTSTTDTLTDPYHNIEIEMHKREAQNTSKNTHPPGTHTYKPYDNNNNNINNDDTGMETKLKGTLSTEVLPAPSPQSSLLASCDESLGPETNAVALVKSIKAGEVKGKDLTMDERRLVVKAMRELGQTQDSIADLLKVSRRTIVSDYRVIRHEQALAIQSTSTHELAGEVYDTAKTCIRRALAAGSLKTVSVIMRDMVEVLQSLGVVYRAPKTSMQANLHGDIPGRHTGYQRYMNGIGNDKGKVIEALDCMFNAIDNDGIPEA